MPAKYIAIIGPLGIEIPPKKQGGIEWMVYYLTQGLIEKGWPVLLFAPQGSQSKAKLIAVSKKAMGQCRTNKEAEVSRKLRLELSMLTNLKAEILKRKERIGLIFNHTVSGGFLADLEKITKIPTYHILHLPLYKEIAQVYRTYYSRLITISNSQRHNFSKLNYKATIYNGIDITKFPFKNKPKNQFLFAGKIREGKNPLTAIEAVQSLGKKLILVGKINDQLYFEKKIENHLCQNIIYKGEVKFKQMTTLYGQSKALLFPIKWPEPFGLVMIESMACGTPVIAFNRGAVSEVIKNGQTGFIVNNKKGMIKAMKKIDEIKRKDCRDWVQNNFSKKTMIDSYEKLCSKHYPLLKK